MRASASASGSRSSGLLSIGLLVCLVTLLGACGGGGSGAPLCVPGNSRSCAAVGCPHGAGTQMCEQTGIYTTCLCDSTTGSAGSTGTAGSAIDAGGDTGTAGATVDGAADADATSTSDDAAAEARADATTGEVGPGADAMPGTDATPDGEAPDGEARDGGATDAPGLEVAASSDGSAGDDSDATDAPLTCEADADVCTPDAASG